MCALKTVFALNWAIIQKGEVIVKIRYCRNAAVSPSIRYKLANLVKKPSDRFLKQNTGTK